MPSGRLISEEVKARIVYLLNQGVNRIDIAKRLNISKSTVNKVAQKAGFKSR